MEEKVFEGLGDRISVNISYIISSNISLTATYIKFKQYLSIKSEIKSIYRFIPSIIYQLFQIYVWYSNYPSVISLSELLTRFEHPFQ